MTKQLTLRSLDIPAFHKFGVGFDSLFDEILRIDERQGSINYPPYNIIQINEDEYIISLAVAGFDQDMLDVTKDKNLLVVEGNPAADVQQINYLHKGISNRGFRREFKLADFVEITKAHLELGILSIHLKRNTPEEQKPRKIALTYK